MGSSMSDGSNNDRVCGGDSRRNSRGDSRGGSRGGNITDNMFYEFNEIKNQEQELYERTKASP